MIELRIISNKKLSDSFSFQKESNLYWCILPIEQIEKILIKTARTFKTPITITLEKIEPKC